MKYIFDFDDVLFNTTKQLKRRMFLCLEKIGIPRKISEEYYKTVRKNQFSLKNFISALLIREKINKINAEELYEEILSECKNFTNIKLLKTIKKIGKRNCFIVSNGEKKFQQDKIKRSGIALLFSKIYIVLESKKEIIYALCDKYKNEKIFFIDNKIKFFEDIDLKKCRNLKTILFTDNTLCNNALFDQ